MPSSKTKAAEPFLGKENEAGTSKDPNGNSSDKHLKEKKRTKLLCYGSIILNLLLVALIVITVVYMVSEASEIRRESDLCLDCSYLRLHPDDDLSMFAKHKGDICCVKDGGNYSSMTNKLVERTLKERLISASKQYQPIHCHRDKNVPAVKLVGKWKNEPDPESTRFHWLKWDKAFHSNSGNEKEQLTYDDTYITVGSTGIYQIYSQIVLHNQHPDEPSPHAYTSDRYYVHAIYKQSRSGHDERILGGSYTYYESKNGETTITNHIGSPYQLVRGDKIGVKVHDVSQVVPSNITNFFGMHRIQ